MGNFVTSIIKEEGARLKVVTGCKLQSYTFEIIMTFVERLIPFLVRYSLISPSTIHKKR